MTIGEGTRVPVALVTGGSGSIGQAVIKKLLDAGYLVGISSRNPKVVHSFQQSIDPQGNRTLSVPRVPHDADWAAAAVATVVNTWGSLDVIAGCSGGVRRTGTWDDIQDGDWHEAYQDNVLDPLALVRSAVPHLKHRDGRVVFVGSFVASSPGLWNPHYSSAKAALVHLVKYLARSLAEVQISVNAVSPAYTLTEGLMRTLESSTLSSGEECAAVVDRRLKSMSDKMPIGRLISPNEVAETIVFLITSSRAMSGVNITMDGGMSLFR